MNNDFSKIESLRIRNFRGFHNLEIDGLSGVNLFVGKNNSGKTSIVEAIQLYFSGAERSKISQMLVQRDEYDFSLKRINGVSRDSNLAVEALFFGRPDLAYENPYFSIGPLDADTFNELRVSFTWLEERVEETDGSIRLTPARGQENLFESATIVPGLLIDFRHRELLIPLRRLETRSSRSIRQREESAPLVYVPSSGMTSEDIGATWDSVALTEDEDTVVNFLKIIIPTIEKIAAIQSPLERNGRVLMAKLHEFQKPVPLKSLGEGVNHLLGIILGLVRARGGIFIIDEIENGIHYSVQKALWEIIFDSARRWDIQIFATTHSWDCVRGFAEASHHNNRAVLYRIESDFSSTRAIKFSPNEIDIAIEQNIEVR